MQQIIRNIHLISSVGTELPHDNPHVQKILSKVASAQQLHEIEVNSPQLQGHIENFWKELINRHFPGSRKKNYVPSNPSGWYKVYNRHKKEDDESLEAANATLKKAFTNIAAEKEKNESLILNRSDLPKPPRTGRALSRRGPQKTIDKSSLTFNAGSRTKLNSGKNVLKRARREAMDVAAQHGSLARQMGVGSSKLKTAPRGFLEHSRVASQPPIRAPSGLSSKKPAPALKRQFSPPNRAKSDEPEPVVIDVSDEEDSGSLFDESDDQEPPAKKLRLGPKQSRYPPMSSFFDSDGAESSDTRETPKKSAIAKGKSVASSQPSPLKRKAGGLLPGKPGARHFLNTSSTGPSNKATPSQKPAPAKAPASSVDKRGVVKPAQKASKATSPPAKPSPVSASGEKGVAKLVPSAGRDPSPPQEKSATAGPSHPPQMLPRKKRVDIFMKPRRRP